MQDPNQGRFIVEFGNPRRTDKENAIEYYGDCQTKVEYRIVISFGDLFLLNKRRSKSTADKNSRHRDEDSDQRYGAEILGLQQTRQHNRDDKSHGLRPYPLHAPPRETGQNFVFEGIGHGS